MLILLKTRNMEEKTTKRPRRVMVEDGKLLIMTEVPFKDGDLKKSTNFFEVFDGKAASFTIEALKERIEGCLSSLNANINRATRVNVDGAVWSEGHFSVVAYEAMEDAIERLNDGKMPSKLGALQVLKALRDITYFSDRYKAITERNSTLKMNASEFTALKRYIFDVMCDVVPMSKD